MGKKQFARMEQGLIGVIACCVMMASVSMILVSCQTMPRGETVPPISIELIDEPAVLQTNKPDGVAPESMQALPLAPILNKTELPVTFVWMSDTQGYSKGYPEIFEAMTNWIVNERDTFNIQYVLHTGDVVDNYDDMRQWDNANRALSILDGKVPLFVVAGNHDIHGKNYVYDFYLKFLGSKRFEGLPTFGGAYRDGHGRYDLVDIEGVPAILVSVGYGMGYGVDDKAIDWMNGVLQEYSDRFAILCFHSYMDPDGLLTTDGGVLFQEVVKKNPNVGLVLCGHRHGVNHTAVQLDDNKDGMPDRTVYQFVADYQDESKSGGGYLGLLIFNSTERTISVKTYSPYLDDYNCFDDRKELEEFVIPWDFK